MLTIDELLESKEFDEKLDKCNTVRDIKNLFAQEGYAVAEAEIASVLAPSGVGELNESDLDNVAGGAKFITNWKKIIKSTLMYGIITNTRGSFTNSKK